MADKSLFSQVGNLAFYDTWSPDYVYFRSLYHIVVNDKREQTSSWDDAAAAAIAQKAINDAKLHQYIKNTKSDSIKYFDTKIKEIQVFLQKAYEVEKYNELAYFNTLYKEWEKSLSSLKGATEIPEEMKRLSEILKTQCEGKNEAFDFIEFSALINALLWGFDNAQLVMKHEQNRLLKSQELIDKLIKSRQNQALGVKFRRKKTDESPLTEQEQRVANRAARKLKTEMRTEYLTTGQLTRYTVDKKTKEKQYVIFGGAQLEREIDKPVGDALASWTNEVLEQAINDPIFIDQIANKIQLNYPVNGDFKRFLPAIREQIIQAIIQYGLQNLNTVLNKRITDKVITKVKSELTKSNSQIFDMASTIKINNFDQNFGQHVKDTNLLKSVNTLAEIYNNNAEKLQEAIRNLLHYEEQHSKNINTQSNSLLLEFMRNYNISQGVTGLSQAQQLDELISVVEELQSKVNKISKEYEEKKEKLNDKQKRQTLTVSQGQTSLEVNITIQNGKVNVDMPDFIKQIMKDGSAGATLMHEFNPQSLTTALATIKRRATETLRTTVIQALTQGISSSTKLTEQEIIPIVRNELSSLSINISGKSMAELIPNIQFSQSGQRLLVHWNRSNAAKNDSMVITIKKGTIAKQISARLKPQVSQKVARTIEQKRKLIEQKQEEVARLYQDTIDKKTKELVQSADKSRYSKMTDIMSLNEKTLLQREDELGKSYKELVRMTNNFKKYLEKYGEKNQDLLKKMKSQLLSFRDGFYISHTTKSYNDYQNDIGFLGGALGSNLDMQLERIYDIFSSAAMPIAKEDKEWLRSAIINCFPGSVVGEKNKGAIEAYLGALMCFALFDEGGAETTNVLNYYKQYFDKQIADANFIGGKKILHLYIVDGIYIPGSFVIKRTLNTIEKDVLPAIQKIPSLTKSGAGIEIINNASEKSIINRPIKDTTNPNPEVWAITGTEVAKDVKIQIVFLAGLLDIVTEINKKLGEAIPKSS